MSDGTPVKCQECGHEWETVAEYPQCSDPNDECGRSRNVEPISDSGQSESGTGGMSEREPSPSPDSQSEGEWSPLFEAEQTETDPVDDMSLGDGPTLGDDDESDGEMADDSEGEMADEMAPPELEPEDIELFVRTPFDMAATQRGEHWELGDDELEQLSHAYCRVGNKYMPYLLAEHAPEFMALMTTMAVVGPRVATDKKQSEEQEQEQERERDQSRDSGDRRSGSAADAEFDDSDFAYSAV